MSDALSHLTKKQTEAVLAICDPTLALMSDEELARKIGVSDRSLRRWRHMPLFRQAIEETRQLPEYRRTFLEENRLAADRILWELVQAGNLKALDLYYRVTGTLQQAAREAPTEYNGIKIIFEERTATPQSVEVVEVQAE